MERTAPVLIVGGGPAGLMTALLLARQGVASTLVERRPRVSGLPKARGMHARAMEIFRSLDLEQEFVARTLPLEPVARIQSTLAGPVLRSMPTGGPALTPVSPCEGASVPQDVVEAVLRDRVDASPLIEARWGTRCTAIATDPDGVTAGLDAGAGPRPVRARYLVGADGARSTVRELLGIPLVGEPDFPVQRLIAFRADLRRWVGDRPGAIYLLTAAGSVLLWTHPDDRWVLNLAASDAPAAAAVRSVLGTPDLEPEILADGTFSPGTTCAARLRQGPVFLLGDAAHRVTPAGGTGMNMAIQDAHNLAWKLAAVLTRTAGPALLDSYAAEREPVGRRNAADSRAAWTAGVGAIGAEPEAGRPAPARGPREIDMGHTYRSAAILDDGRPDPPARPGPTTSPPPPPAGGRPICGCGPACRRSTCSATASSCWARPRVAAGGATARRRGCGRWSSVNPASPSCTASSRTARCWCDRTDTWRHAGVRPRRDRPVPPVSWSAAPWTACWVAHGSGHSPPRRPRADPGPETRPPLTRCSTPRRIKL